MLPLPGLSLSDSVLTHRRVFSVDDCCGVMTDPKEIKF